MTAAVKSSPLSVQETLRRKCDDKEQAYLHGLVEPFCEVGSGVLDAFHCDKRRRCHRNSLV